MHTRLTEYEKERRADIDTQLPNKAAVGRVSGHAELVEDVLNRVAQDRPNTDSLTWRHAAHIMRWTAAILSPASQEVEHHRPATTLGSRT